MTAIICAALTAIGFYFSVGLGEQWWLIWLAPIPALWLAFGETKGWTVFFAAWVGCALGSANILRAYAGVMPAPVMVLAIAGPALTFAASVMCARRVQRSFGSLPAMLAFAAAWTAFDFLTAFDKAGGSIPAIANAEVGAPILIQIASLTGFLGVTFLIGVVSAGLALSLRTRDPAPAILAIALFAANAGYGYWRMSAPPEGMAHVALIDSNDTVGAIRKSDKTRTFKAIDAYAAEIAKLHDASVQLIVLPENIALIDPAWRDEAEAKLAAVVPAGATLVAGFNTLIDGAQRNVSWAFAPGATMPVTYEKRRLVKGLETLHYTPGPEAGARALANGTGLEICKDMDFQDMVRRDEVATHPVLLAVPAWDFDTDDWSHARVAVMRSVENGVPMARSARDGLLTLNDRYGRVVAEKRTVGPFTTLIGDLPLAGRGGDTVYDHIGDVLGWVSIVLGLGLVGATFVRPKSEA